MMMSVLAWKFVAPASPLWRLGKVPVVGPVGA